MKWNNRIFLLTIICFIAGMHFYKCQSPKADEIGSGSGCIVDTITYIDTIAHYEPFPTHTSQIGMKKFAIPSAVTIAAIDSVTRISADTEIGEIIIDGSDNDSMKIELPMVQSVYEDTTYKAYVSGIYPRLDSIFVYPRREVVTIKKPPKRWHIGPTIGYGITPQGFQPYIGVSVTYSIFSY